MTTKTTLLDKLHEANLLEPGEKYIPEYNHTQAWEVFNDYLKEHSSRSSAWIIKKYRNSRQKRVDYRTTHEKVGVGKLAREKTLDVFVLGAVVGIMTAKEQEAVSLFTRIDAWKITALNACLTMGAGAIYFGLGVGFGVLETVLSAMPISETKAHALGEFAMKYHVAISIPRLVYAVTTKKPIAGFGLEAIGINAVTWYKKIKKSLNENETFQKISKTFEDSYQQDNIPIGFPWNNYS
ncbi:MAG: hypothetical protein ABIB43_05250 [archaeon]